MVIDEKVLQEEKDYQNNLTVGGGGGERNKASFY